MKKIIVIVLAVSSLFFLTVSNAIAEWSAGISLSTGAYEASGTETQEGENEKSSRAEEGQFTYPSIFFEYNVGRVSFGLDYIPGSVETEEQSRTDYNTVDTGNDGGGTSPGVTNTVKVELSNHVSLYALVPITDIGAFARVQVIRVNVETNETLGTGSKYPDTHMKGGSLSLGYQHDTGGAFVRAEVGYTDYEGISVTASNTANRVDAEVDGEWARISIGKAF